MNGILHCPNPMCGKMVAKSLGFHGKVGDMVGELVCPHCKEHIEVYLSIEGRIKQRESLTPSRVGVE